jgi:hypothetical protein
MSMSGMMNNDCNMSEEMHLLESARGGVEPLPSNKLLARKNSQMEADKGIFVSKRMGVAVALLWVGSLGFVARTGKDPLELDEDNGATTAVSGDTPSMFKRTHLSINAIKEGIWLERTFGFGQPMNEYWNEGSGENSLDEQFGMDADSQWEEQALSGIDLFCLSLSLSLSFFLCDSDICFIHWFCWLDFFFVMMHRRGWYFTYIDSFCSKQTNKCVTKVITTMTSRFVLQDPSSRGPTWERPTFTIGTSSRAVRLLREIMELIIGGMSFIS